MLLFCVIGGEKGDIVGYEGGLVVWKEVSLGIHLVYVMLFGMIHWHR